MSMEDFQAQLRERMYAKPFHSYVVELLDGTIIEVRQPELAMAGGHAAFIAGDELVEFNCEEVRDIRQMSAGAAT